MLRSDIHRALSTYTGLNLENNLSSQAKYHTATKYTVSSKAWIFTWKRLGDKWSNHPQGQGFFSVPVFQENLLRLQEHYCRRTETQVLPLNTLIYSQHIMFPKTISWQFSNVLLLYLSLWTLYNQAELTNQRFRLTLWLNTFFFLNWVISITVICPSPWFVCF